MNLVGTCFCKRRHDNIGYTPNERKQPLWCCTECLNTQAPDGESIVRKVYFMSTKTFDIYESQALIKGGEAGGEVLESLGKTDLAELQQTEWVQFLAAVLKGYSKAMRDSLESGKAPF